MAQMVSKPCQLRDGLGQEALCGLRELCLNLLTDVCGPRIFRSFAENLSVAETCIVRA